MKKMLILFFKKLVGVKEEKVMRKDQCLFCYSRKCNTRIVSTADNGATYDEVACVKHSEKLHKHSDEKAPKVMKLFQSSTGNLKRGEDISDSLKDLGI